jgi:hypothetical protein
LNDSIAGLVTGLQGRLIAPGPALLKAHALTGNRNALASIIYSLYA